MKLLSLSMDGQEAGMAVINSVCLLGVNVVNLAELYMLYQVQ